MFALHYVSPRMNTAYKEKIQTGFYVLVTWRVQKGNGGAEL